MFYIIFLTSVSIIVHCAAALPSTGIGSLSAREAEGRSNISAGDKVMPCKILFHKLSDLSIFLYKYIHLHLRRHPHIYVPKFLALCMLFLAIELPL